MKKLIYIVLLIIIIAGGAFFVANAKKQEAKVVPAGTTKGKSLTDDKSTTNSNEATIEDENDTSQSIQKEENYIETELSDGILYSKDGKEVKADVIIDDKYFDTTINDIWTNPDSYKNKNIQIEGMYLENLPYTFVGRYAESSLCPNCPPGYSYFEYQLDGKLDRKFTDEKEWIKVIGTLEVGNDETTGYTDFYYLKVLTLEVMNEKGQT
nr:hypothetical protein [Clostridia bacterium]